MRRRIREAATQPAFVVADVPELLCEPRTVELGPGPSPADVLTRLAGDDGLACLWGDGWGGGALICSEPLAAGADRSALAAQPELVGPAQDGFVGGGWVGWLGYDRPDWLAFYDNVLRWDEASDQWTLELLWSPSRADALDARLERVRALLREQSGRTPTNVGAFRGADPASHLAAVERAIGLIRDGEIYQVNVCTRLGADFSGEPAELFATAAERLGPAYGCFVDSGPVAVASMSPELFLHRHGRQVSSSPIKGTRPRLDGGRGAQELRRSAKDMAENVMIVDLTRNDLGRVCEPGSVRASELLTVAAHPGVWHLVSTVRGRLRADVDDTALVAAAFPPGSVTGAPKVRAVQAIAELEDEPRGVYTGAIGLAGPCAGLTLAVAIRTFEITDGRIELGVGGGVTAESVPVLEWRECLHKAAPLLRAIGAGLRPVAAGIPVEPDEPSEAQLRGGLLETMLAVDGRVLRLADHLTRLDLSCRELYGRPSPLRWERVAEFARTQPWNRVVVRAVVKPTGDGLEVDLHARPAPDGLAPGAGRLHTRERLSGCWRHKWADRGGFEADEHDGLPLYLGAQGEVLETSRGNVFVVGRDGTVVAPPLRDDLLPGVTRLGLLDHCRDVGRPVELRAFDLNELVGSAGAFWTSSVSGIVAIGSVDGVPLAPLDEAWAQAHGALGFDRR